MTWRLRVLALVTTIVGLVALAFTAGTGWIE
jgi:hypothetical protein